MIIKKSRDKAALTATAEDADDLLALRRVIKRGDIVTGSTTRVIKRDRDYSRPDRGERVRIVASVVVERISLDGTLERLKIGGTVSESNNDDAVPHGAHHSLAVTAGSTITIAKRSAKSGRSRWSGTDHRILQRRGGATSGKKESFLLVAVDTNDCGVASLRGTHLEVTPNIYSGIGGKRYKTSRGMDDFFDKAAAAIDALLDDGVQKIVMFGPGNTKRRLANYMYSGSTGQSRGRSARGVRGCDITVVEGIDSGGEDGIYTFTKSEAMREVMSESKLAVSYTHLTLPTIYSV